MSSIYRYPKDDEVKVKWQPVQIGVVMLSILIWPLFIVTYDICGNFIKKLISVLGLHIDLIGAVVASLKTPHFGDFYDGGRLESTRAKVEQKYFQMGMSLVAAGFLLQAIASIL